MARKYPQATAAVLLAVLGNRGTSFYYDADGKIYVDHPERLAGADASYPLFDVVMSEAERNANELMGIFDAADRFTEDVYMTHMKTMPYQQYLGTNHWQIVRKHALEAAGNRCQICNSTRRLQVHHRTYDRRGNEALDDVIVLCSECHRLFHEHGRLAKGGR